MHLDLKLAYAYVMQMSTICWLSTQCRWSARTRSVAVQEPEDALPVRTSVTATTTVETTRTNCRIFVVRRCYHDNRDDIDNIK